MCSQPKQLSQWIGNSSWTPSCCATKHRSSKFSRPARLCGDFGGKGRSLAPSSRRVPELGAVNSSTHVENQLFHASLTASLAWCGSHQQSREHSARAEVAKLKPNWLATPKIGGVAGLSATNSHRLFSAEWTPGGGVEVQKAISADFTLGFFASAGTAPEQGRCSHGH